MYLFSPEKYMLQMLVWNLYFYVAIIRKYLFFIILTVQERVC